MKVRKTIKEEISRFERASVIAHKTMIKLREYFISKGVPKDILDDEFTSLHYGDITTEDFVKMLEDEEYKNTGDENDENI